MLIYTFTKMFLTKDKFMEAVLIGMITQDKGELSMNMRKSFIYIRIKKA